RTTPTTRATTATTTRTPRTTPRATATTTDPGSGRRPRRSGVFCPACACLHCARDPYPPSPPDRDLRRGHRVQHVLPAPFGLGGVHPAARQRAGAALPLPPRRCVAAAGGRVGGGPAGRRPA